MLMTGLICSVELIHCHMLVFSSHLWLWDVPSGVCRLLRHGSAFFLSKNELGRERRDGGSSVFSVPEQIVSQRKLSRALLKHSNTVGKSTIMVRFPSSLFTSLLHSEHLSMVVARFCFPDWQVILGPQLAEAELHDHWRFSVHCPQPDAAFCIITNTTRGTGPVLTNWLVSLANVTSPVFQTLCQLISWSWIWTAEDDLFI